MLQCNKQRQLFAALANTSVRNKVCRGVQRALHAAGVHASAEHVDDVLQELRLRILRKGHQFEFRSQPVTWLYRVAYTIGLRYAQNAIRNGEYTVGAFGDFGAAEKFGIAEVENAVDSTFEQACADEASQRLEAALARVTPEQRELLLLFAEGGVRGYTQVAAERGVPVGTLKAQVHRARKAVLFEYEKSGGNAASRSESNG